MPPDWRRQMMILSPGARAAGRGCVFHDPSAGEHEDAIEMCEGGKPVGDDDHRLANHGRIERRLNLVLGDGVEARGRLVQDEDWRVLEDHTGYRDALAPPSRQPDAVLYRRPSSGGPFRERGKKGLENYHPRATD